jgi:hypothetical protein
MNKNFNNVPAFPITSNCCNEGMTLRDYFAIRILTSYIERGYNINDQIDVRAYNVADEMLKTRQIENLKEWKVPSEVYEKAPL